MENDKDPADTARLPKMLNSTQVAKALGVNPSTLSRWRSEGIGPRVYWLGTSSPRRSTEMTRWQKADFIAEPGLSQPRKAGPDEAFEIRYRVIWAE